MGQYYKVVNIDKKEVLEPHNFGHGAKLMEFGYSYTEIVQTLIQKMLKEWKGDRIFVIGDYAEKDDCISEIESQTVANLEETLNIVGKTTFYEGTEYPVTCYNIAERENGFISLDAKDLTSDFENQNIHGGHLYNHKQKCFVDLNHCPTNWYFKQGKKYYRNCTSAVILLLALGNGRGGGDFRSENEDLLKLVGSWTLDMFEDGNNIEFSIDKIPNTDDYNEFNPDFVEGNGTLVSWDNDQENKRLLEKTKEECERYEKEQKLIERKIHFQLHPYKCSVMLATSLKNSKGVCVNSFKIFNKESNTVTRTIEKLILKEDADNLKSFFEISNKNGFVNQRSVSFNKNDIFFFKEDSNSYPDCYISDELCEAAFSHSEVRKYNHDVNVVNYYSVVFKTDDGENDNFIHFESFFPKNLSSEMLKFDYRATLESLQDTTGISDFETQSKKCKLILEKLKDHNIMVDDFIANFDTSKEYSEETLKKVGDQ